MHFILPNDPQSFSHKSGMNGKGEKRSSGTSRARYAVPYEERNSAKSIILSASPVILREAKDLSGEILRLCLRMTTLYCPSDVGARRAVPNLDR
jgi:hypothetical protein